jgi:hypothetical protein
MSTVNGLNSNFYIYNPTLNTYKNENSLLQDFESSKTSSATDLTMLSNELNQINQGINPQEADKYETQASQAGIASIQKNPLYNSMMSNYSTGLNLIESVNGSATTDSITSLSSELNLLNEGINEIAIPSIAGLLGQTSSTTGLTALEEELSQLSSKTNINNNTLSPANSNTKDNNILNYEYNPSSGVNTNPYNNISTGSNLDLKF